MPQAMAQMIEIGSNLSTLEGQSYTWRIELSGYTGEPGGPNEPGQAVVTEFIIIPAAEGSFSRDGNDLIFQTNADIEITNEIDGVSTLTVDSLVAFVRIGTTNHPLIPNVSLNATLQPFQTLRITELKLRVNE